MASYDEIVKQKVCRAIREIARSQRIPMAEVRAEMEKAMLAGYSNPDPAVQAEWAKAPFSGHDPTLEEFIAWCVDRISGESQPKQESTHWH